MGRTAHLLVRARVEQEAAAKLFNEVVGTPRAPTLPSGVRVKIGGLQSEVMREHNGRLGTVVSWDPPSSLYLVKLHALQDKPELSVHVSAAKIVKVAVYWGNGEVKLAPPNTRAVLNTPDGSAVVVTITNFAPDMAVVKTSTVGLLGAEVQFWSPIGNFMRNNLLLPQYLFPPGRGPRLADVAPSLRADRIRHAVAHCRVRDPDGEHELHGAVSRGWLGRGG